MTAHEIDNRASRFPENLSEAQISELNKMRTNQGFRTAMVAFNWLIRPG